MAARRRSSIATINMEALDCAICYNPLEPPVFFHCGVGHVICSSCHGKLADRSSYHVCNIVSGYNRCIAVDHILYAITVPCPNAAHGCAVRMTYHDVDEHAGRCPHAPCFCPEPVCGFAAGGPAALLAHFTGMHGWPVTGMRRNSTFGVEVREG
ncbi:putative E3 ubiquitin-protein ligase SINA-like 9 [Oryza sativa Japonica Group]|uniref:putative E3 ubiquitin-protein ligase SINA-like 9 n=1 Tax=Oryza sativa subsp. japonica TaxID=39947 RepID=UPI000E1BE8D9|nr:putative E3 ubiquitin-protein ligase SINA-like 9 [Oryza sativa Japonica Group]